ncbi:hypothetical protein SAMN04487761_10964 [Lachnospiraceae bacterium C7]|nr:hypothetical protein SAMN04487761_10964 [Lachnospiraceae bacterium C7]
MKKKIGWVVAAILCIAAICGVFYYTTQNSKKSVEDPKKLTKIEETLNKDLNKTYPKTPREVVKYYNKILECYYNEKPTKGQVKKLCKKSLQIFDDDLAKENPIDSYVASVQKDIDLYNESSKRITQSSVCSSNDVLYKKDKGDEIAYVEASYFMKESKKFTKSYQTYVLRKDEKGNWKILVWYKTEKTS